MKIVGQRQVPPVTLHATSEQLVVGARFSEAIVKLSQVQLIPKGVSRFKTHGEANRHWESCLAHGMAALASTRPSHD